MAKTFKWTVEFEVVESWVADGFEMTDERAFQMLENDLCHAYHSELSAKVIKFPDRMEVLKVQGYKKDDIIKALKVLAESDKSLPLEIADQINKLRCEEET